MPPTGQLAAELLDHTLSLLQRSIRASGLTQLEVDRRIGRRRGFLSHVFQRKVDIKAVDLLRTLSVLGLEPRSFFRQLATEAAGGLAAVGLERTARVASGEARGYRHELVEGLLAASFERRFESAREMRVLAEAAAVLARELDPAVYGEERARHFEVRATAELANAMRVQGDLDAADETMARAFERLSGGSVEPRLGDPLLAARLHELRSSLLRCRNRFAEAMADLDRAFDLYWRHGARHEAGTVLLNRAATLSVATRAEEALAEHEKGLALLEPGRDPQVELAGLHNTVALLVGLGRFAEAADRMRQLGQLHAAHGGRLSHLRVSWLEGRIALGLGDAVRAERLFLETRRGMLEQELAYEAAEVGLDLALLYGQQGRVGELARVVDETVTAFKAYRVEREALAALLVLKEAVARQREPLLMIERVADFLVRHRQDPSLRFES